ncbi:MAG: hypothetical protein Q4A07_08865 [Coriobacteriales bacterium]|nr:hypothetical protein [Coriobacteriales bacterium]
MRATGQTRCSTLDADGAEVVHSELLDGSVATVAHGSDAGDIALRCNESKKLRYVAAGE